MALAELGESNAADTDNRFQSRELIEVGLGSLATPEGTVRRDSWEQAYEAAVRSFNRGQCLLPFDGIARQSDGETPRNFRGRLAEADVEIRFDPAQPVIGLPFLIQIVNNGTRPAFMEVVVTSVEGQIVRATPGVLEVASGKAVKIPIAKVNAKAGRESITVYASHQRFLPGEVLSFNKDGRLGRLGHGMRDRFVHRWLYQLPENSARPIPSADGDPLIKITRDVETRK
jgi:hypothetical protein